MKIFRRRAGYTLFDHKRSEEILEDLEVDPVDEKLYIKIILATTCNKNEQEDAQNNAKL
jgi:hypothetical protein